MFLMVNRLIALSFGVHREQLEQRIGFTWPRPFLFLPFEALFLTIFTLLAPAVISYVFGGCGNW